MEVVVERLVELVVDLVDVLEELELVEVEVVVVLVVVDVVVVIEKVLVVITLEVVRLEEVGATLDVVASDCSSSPTHSAGRPSPVSSSSRVAL